MEPKPATKLPLLGFLLLLIACVVEYSTGAGAGAGNGRTQMCNGSIAECNAEGEFLMESDISRVMLEAHSSISYKALKKDQPACDSSGRGKSYRSCYPDPSNPYTRGCSQIYRCRGGDS